MTSPVNKGKLTSAAYSVACPVCPAPAGKKCVLYAEQDTSRARQPGEPAYGPHPQRLTLAREVSR